MNVFDAKYENMNNYDSKVFSFVFIYYTLSLSKLYRNKKNSLRFCLMQEGRED